MVRQKHGTALRDRVTGTAREWVFCKPPTSTSTLTWCSTPQRVTEEKPHHCPHTTTQPHASLLTDSTARTPHTHTHTQNTAKHDRERERQKAEGSEEKERAEFKTNIRRKRKTKNNKKSKEDFWGASTYWIILEIWNTIWQHTLPSWPTHLVQKRHCQ